MARGFSQAMAREAGLLMPVPPPSKVRDMTLHLDPVALQAMREVGPTLAHKGRGGDSLLVHLDPVEAEVLRDAGGSGGINPRTGLREYQDGTGTGTSGGGGGDDGNNGAGSVGGGGSSSSSSSSSPGSSSPGGGGGYSTSFGFGEDMGYTTPESQITGPGLGPQGGSYTPGDYEDGARGRTLADTGRYGPMGGIEDKAHTPDPANADDWRNEGFTEKTDLVSQLVSFLTPVTPGYTYDPETRSIKSDISQTDLAAGLLSTFMPTPVPLGIPFTDINLPTAVNMLRDWAKVNDVTVEDDYSAGERTNSQDRDQTLWDSTLDKIGDPTRLDDKPGTTAPKLDGSVKDQIDKLFSNLSDREGLWTGTVLDKGKVDMGNGGFSKQVLGQQLSAFGRNGDTMVAHINPREAALLQSMGGSGTLNPVTGLPEFWSEADVNKAYQSILGRAPEAEGLANWTANNPNGSYADLAAQIGSSPEAKARSAVTSAYESNLGRAPEAPALAAWTNAATSSPGGIAGVTKDIANSDEAQNSAINRAYQTYLGRGAESADVVQGYNTQMDNWLSSGLDPYAELGKAFQGSEEYKTKASTPTAPVLTQPAPAQQQFDYTGLMKQFQDMMGTQQNAYNDQLRKMQEQYSQQSSAVPDILSATPLQAGLTNSPQLTGTTSTGVRRRTPRIDPLTGAVTWDEDTPAGFAAYDPQRASRRSGFGSIMRF